MDEHETIWGSTGSGEGDSTAPDGLVAGRYEILGLAGAGAMGSVYRAHDRVIDEIVALKTIRPELANVPGIVEQLRLELKLARKVTHRNVARVFDIGEHAGITFLSMEFLDGEPLSAWIRPGGISAAEAVDLVVLICDGLAAAHAAGIIHRDLKPDNVIVGKDGRVTVTDFGVACLSEGAASDTIVGTPAYMAPEQVAGGAVLDVRADVYAVGLILFELLSGVDAFSGDSVVEVANARLRGTIPDLAAARPGLAPELVAVVTKALAFRREDRHASAVDLGRALVAARPAQVERGQFGRRARRPKKVAVLPFVALSGPEDAYVADALTEDLIDVISMTRGLEVRSSSVVAPFAGRREVRAVAAELGVEVVVEGSVRRRGDAFEIVVRLVGASDGLRIWRESFRRPVQELLPLVDAVARAVCGALSTEVASAPRKAASDPRALEGYFRARAFMRSGWYRFEDVRDAVRLLEAASALAPSDPTILAAFALGRARLVFLDRTDPEGARRRAAETARRAVSLAPLSGESWLALSSVHVYEGASAKAVPALVRAIRTAPSLAKAREMLGRILIEAGLIAEGRELLEAALALDPRTFSPRWDIIQAHALSGAWHHVWPLLALSVGDRGGEEMRTLLRARFALWRNRRRTEADLGPAPAATDPGAAIARAFWQVAVRGRLDDAGEIDVLLAPAAGRARRIILQFAAELFLACGDPRAGEMLSQAIAAGADDLAWLEGCPLLVPLRSDPRWAGWHASVAERARGVRIAWAATSSQLGT